MWAAVTLFGFGPIPNFCTAGEVYDFGVCFSGLPELIFAK
jgi:hypothetical protein